MFSITNKSVSRREIKKIKKTRAAYKKRCDYSRESSSDKSDYNNSLSRDSDWDKSIRRAGNKEMNKLYHLVNNNIKTNKDQLNDTIYNELTFDTIRFGSSSGTRHPLPVETITLWGGKKHRVITVLRRMHPSPCYTRNNCCSVFLTSSEGNSFYW